MQSIDHLEKIGMKSFTIVGLTGVKPESCRRGHIFQDKRHADRGRYTTSRWAYVHAMVKRK